MIAFLTTADSLRLLKPAGCFFTGVMVAPLSAIAHIHCLVWYPTRQYEPSSGDKPITPTASWRLISKPATSGANLRPKRNRPARLYWSAMALLPQTARRHGLHVMTRNTEHFTAAGRSASRPGDRLNLLILAPN